MSEDAALSTASAAFTWDSLAACLHAPRVGAQKFAKTIVAHPASGKFNYGLRRCFFAGRKAIPIEFEKKNTDDETRTFVAIYERVVLHNARRVLRRTLDNIGTLVGEMVQRTTERRLEQSFITQPLAASVLNKLPIMDCEHKVLLYPNRLAHFDRTWSVFR